MTIMTIRTKCFKERAVTTERSRKSLSSVTLARAVSEALAAEAREDASKGPLVTMKKPTFIKYLLCTEHCSKYFTCIIFFKTSQQWGYYYPHFTDEKAGACRNLPRLQVKGLHTMQ